MINTCENNSIGNDENFAAKNDALKDKLVSGLKRCDIDIDQMEVMILQARCIFESIEAYPDSVECIAICSHDFSIGNVRYATEQMKEKLRNKFFLKNNDSLLDIRKILEQIFEEFSNELSDFIVCAPIPKILDPVKQNFLVAIVELKKENRIQYRELIHYVIEQILADRNDINTVDGLVRSEFIPRMTASKRVLLENYVDYFLEKNRLPQAEVLIELSAEKYEGSESEARIYFDGCKRVTNVEVLDELGKEARFIRSENRRMIRKMMEISKEGTVHLFAERQGETRDCLITKLVKGHAKTGLYIKFFGYLCWGIVCDEKEIVIYEKGRYLLNSSQEVKEYSAKIRKLEEKIGLSSMPEQLQSWFQADILCKLIKVLEKQKHGTAVIITDCRYEAERLCKLNRGILIKSNKGICWRDGIWDSKQLLGITSIDGAVLMDLDGNCMAIGVIVDGEAKIEGDTGKGARYNSIVNYVRQKDKREVYLGIIVSEDGMIELICNLEPD